MIGKSQLCCYCATYDANNYFAIYAYVLRSINIVHHSLLTTLQPQYNGGFGVHSWITVISEKCYNEEEEEDTQ